MKLIIFLSILISLSAFAVTVSPTTTTRTVNTNFQPSTIYDAHVIYSLTSTCTATLLGGQTQTIELRSDAASVPTTVRSTYTNSNSVALAIAITVVNTQAGQLSYIVPRGHFVRLNSTGSCTSVSVVSQVEEQIKPEFDAVDFTTGFPFK